jgi:predicted Zn-dependent protease
MDGMFLSYPSLPACMYISYTTYHSTWSISYFKQTRFDPHHTMHEIGHSLGMGHSGEGDSYGDESCIMGKGLNNDINFGAPI